MGIRKTKVLLCSFISESYRQEHYYSLGLGYLKAYAEKSPLISQNFDIEIIAFKHGEENHFQIIRDFNADIVGFSCYLWSTDYIPDIIEKLHSSKPGTTFVIGGATLNLENHFDSLPDGTLLCENYMEGEGVFLDILAEYIGEKNYPGIPGLWVAGNGIIEKSKPREPISDVNTIPCPYESNAINTAPGSRVFTLEVARGCVHSCSFCMFSYNRHEKMRYFSLDRIAAQVRWAIERNFKSIDLLASAINYSTSRFSALCRVLKRENHEGKTKFSFCMHPAHITPEQIEVLSDILPMTEYIVAGVQSLSPTVGETMNRRSSPEIVLKGIELLSNVFPANADLIAGLPGETIDSLKNSVRSLMPFPINLTSHHFSVLPGTRYDREKHKYGICHKNSTESFIAESCNSFSSSDFKAITTFFNEVRDSGEFQNSGLLSLNFGNGLSLSKNDPPRNDISSGTNSEEHSAPDEFIDQSLLCAILPLVGEGAVFQGWTSSDTTVSNVEINTIFRHADMELHLLLKYVKKVEPHFSRTDRLYIIYKHPDTLNGSMQTWLRDLSKLLAEADRNDAGNSRPGTSQGVPVDTI